MADPATYRPAPGSIPEYPGVYRFRDAHGRVIYVGKAKNLRSRLNSYFADFATLHPRTQAMLRSAASVDWTVVATEVEALQLEYSWIKEYDPRFNVRYRDDKSYPYLAVTLDETYPRVMVLRGAKRRGVRYFGPYSHAWAIRETVDLLLRVFPVRTCSAGVFKRARQIGRPCLLGYIGKCSAPCVERVNAATHRLLAEEFCDFMAGNTTRFIRRLERQMQEAASAEEFERAARLRDDIQALHRALEKQAVVLGDGTDCDVIALTEDQLEAAVQVFYIRGGRVRGQRGWVVDKVEDVSTPELVEHFLGQVYGDDPALDAAPNPVADAAPDPPVDAVLDAEAAAAADSGQDNRHGTLRGKRRLAGRGSRSLAGSGASVPREVLVPVLPPDAEAMGEWLAARRGGRVDLRVPQRGDKKALLGVVTRNAAESLALHKTRRASDLTTRSRALNEIQEALGLEEAPLRIECYDVSNLQGSNVVASMVVFEDGLARKGEYRRFSVRQQDGQGDVAAIHEVISRRFRRYLEERGETGELDALAPVGTVPHGGTPDPDGPEPKASWLSEMVQPGTKETGQRRFAYPPGLVVVDGGPAQAAAARHALDELGIEDVAVCGLAKRLEEVWLPGDDAPVILPRTSEGLYLLQRVRDEAHRFAITYHRAKRSKALTESELDEVPGLGPARRKALLRHFGSVRGIREATVNEIAGLPGFGPRTAQSVLAALGGVARGNTRGTRQPDGEAG